MLKKDNISPRITVILVMSYFCIRAGIKLNQYIANETYHMSFYLYIIVLFVSIGCIAFFGNEIFKLLKKSNS